MKTITQMDLESPYNSFMAGCEWVVIEEVEGFKDAKRIKSLTGAKTFRLSEKYEKGIDVKNNANIIINSNELKTLQIDENDRRFNVGGGGLRLSPIPPFTWKETYFNNEKSNKLFFKNFSNNLDEEIKSLYAYLIALNVERVEVQQLINTKERRNLINLGKTSEKIFIDEILENGLYGVLKLVEKNYNNIILDLIKNIDSGINKGNWISSTDFYNLFFKYHNEYLKSSTRPISNKIFYSRIINYKYAKNLIGDRKQISFNGENHRYIELKNIRKKDKFEVEEIDLK
ncbi:MAG: DUF5906 domain-containing protein [Candidatus Helarchaeota archaeon]